MEEIVLENWTLFKTLAVTKQLGFNYNELPGRYDIYLNEGVLVWKIILYKDEGADVTDFETNIKSLSNKPTFFLGQFRNKYRNITGNTTVTVKSGNGVLRGITINNNNTGGTFTIYDNTAGSGTKIGTIVAGTPSGGLLSTTGLQSPVYTNFTVEFSTGLTIVTSGSSNNDITVCYV